MPSVLYIVVPCYKDEDTLIASVPVFLEKIGSLVGAGKIAPSSRLVLVNDGSPDRTWETILSLREKDKTRITAINLEKNVGEQNALIAGMTYAAEKADCVITMDSDLQDDINAVDQMLALFEEGKDVVFGVRSDRSKDGLFERLCSRTFYALMTAAKTGLMNEHSNYRLLSKRAILRLIDDLPENYFLPCAVSNLPVPGAVVFHERRDRIAGTSSYGFRRKLRLAKDALFSHSAFPLKLMSLAALVCSGLFVLFFVLWLALPEETASLTMLVLAVISIAFAAVFVCQRIIGEYAYKAFEEAKQKKKYQIDTILE